MRGLGFGEGSGADTPVAKWVVLKRRLFLGASRQGVRRDPRGMSE